MSEHHVWTANSVNRLFKIQKSLQQSAFLTNCLWCKWVKSGWDGEVIAIMYFEFLNNLFTELAVHVWVWFLVCLLLISCHANG